MRRDHQEATMSDSGPTLYVRPDACNAALSFPGMTTRFECSRRGRDGEPHDSPKNHIHVGFPLHIFEYEDEHFSIDWTDGCPWTYRFDRATGRRLEVPGQ